MREDRKGGESRHTTPSQTKRRRRKREKEEEKRRTPGWRTREGMGTAGRHRGGKEEEQEEGK